MLTDYLPNRDAEFAAWLNNFVNVAEDNMTLLGLVAADLTKLGADNTAFQNHLDAVPIAKAAAEAAVKTKDGSRRVSTADVRVVVRKIQANPTVSAALKTSLGITVPASPGGKVTPVPPAGLVVNGLDTGTNLLQWKANGNKKGTAYRIEAQMGDDAMWTPVDVVTSTRYEHTGQTPGVRAQYRVVARRRTTLSGPSNTGVVYG